MTDRAERQAAARWRADPYHQAEADDAQLAHQEARRAYHDKHFAGVSEEHREKYRCWCHNLPVGYQEMYGVDDQYMCSPGEVMRYLEQKAADEQAAADALRESREDR